MGTPCNRGTVERVTTDGSFSLRPRDQPPCRRGARVGLEACSGTLVAEEGNTPVSRNGSTGTAALSSR